MCTCTYPCSLNLIWEFYCYFFWELNQKKKILRTPKLSKFNSLRKFARWSCTCLLSRGGVLAWVKQVLIIFFVCFYLDHQPAHPCLDWMLAHLCFCWMLAHLCLGWRLAWVAHTLAWAGLRWVQKPVVLRSNVLLKDTFQSLLCNKNTSIMISKFILRICSANFYIPGPVTSKHWRAASYSCEVYVCEFPLKKLWKWHY